MFYLFNSCRSSNKMEMLCHKHCILLDVLFRTHIGITILCFIDLTAQALNCSFLYDYFLQRAKAS